MGQHDFLRLGQVAPVSHWEPECETDEATRRFTHAGIYAINPDFPVTPISDEALQQYAKDAGMRLARINVETGEVQV